MKTILKLVNKLAEKCSAGVFATILVAVIFIAVLVFSWICTCGLIKLITLCFGWTFSWRIATGIWLVTYLVRTVLNHTITVKK